MRASATGSVSVVKLVRQLFIFPPFSAFIVALIAPLFVDMSPLMPLLDKIVATLVPMALFSVGLQLNFSGWREELSPLSMALTYKLLIAPALIFILMLVWKLKGLMPEITVFQGSMAPRITSGVVAAHYSLNPRLANLIIGIGILLSFLTTAIWWLVMNQLN
jgi:predicted permease